MKKIKYIKRQDSGFKLSYGNSGETSLNLSNEIFSFISQEGLSLGDEKEIAFRIYKEDCIKAMSFVIMKLPLYKSSSNSSNKVENHLETFSELHSKIESFFGYKNNAEYRVRLFYRTDGRIYLKGLRVNGFSIRDYLVENYSALQFDDEGDSILNLRILSDIEDNGELENDEVEQVYNKTNQSLQKIYFGTPGSGKSWTIKKKYEMRKDGDKYVEDEEKKKRVKRTTFHPDTDYASFVGCYKPVKDDEDEKKIVYEFVPQAFTDAYVAAWSDLDNPYYLIIEEINRGNCAQIFGDLFQLLDRNKYGYSEYPIKADHDLRDYLEENLPEDSEGIRDGKICLPPNLSIIASMNTSDQSLFPMDSAFKRRWSWEYVPIDYENSESGAFTITIGDKTYNWHTFLKAVNKKIKAVTSSEDKQMGNFFIKSSVDEKEFCDKVMFYLWSEVGKDNYQTNDAIFKYYTEDDRLVEFSFNELYEATKKTDILKGFIRYIEEEK